ncbi:hypothetical protein ACHFI2_16150, partial [Exiguobacterium acetylicum]|uniref:phage tail protein n=2 Tax=Bacillati TaxID=1783272 RepID=UPI003876690F
MAKNTVIVSVLGDTKDLASKLGDAGSSFGKWAKLGLAATAAVGAALAGAAVKGVKSASELEQNMGALGSVFKDNAAQMESWATKAAGSVGLAKSEYAGLATVLGSQLRNMGVSSEQLAGQTNSLIGLGADLAAQFGGSTSDAVSALSSLLRGERDPIERYGVSMNEAAVTAKMAEMGLSGLSGEAEKNAKLQATLAILMQQTADAQGAFSRESTTLAGAQQRLAAGTENLFAIFGTSLLPAITAVTAAAGAMINAMQESAWFGALTANLTAASNAFADFVFGLMNGTSSLDFGQLLSGLLPAVVSGITSAATWIANGGTLQFVNALNQGRTQLLGAALQVFQAIAEALPVVLPAIVSSLLIMLQDVINLLVASIPQIIQVAVLMFSGLITGITLALPEILTTLVAILPSLVTALLGMLPAILQAAVQLFQSLVAAIPVIVPLLLTAIVQLLPELVTSILSMLPGILDAAINLFTALVESIPVILPLLLSAIITLAPQIVSSVLSMIPRLLDAAVRLFTGLVDALPRVVPQLIGALIGLAPQLVGAILGMIPQLISAGVNLIGGLVSGLYRAAGSVASALLSIIKGAVGSFLSFLGIH